MRQSRQVCSATLSAFPVEVQPLRVTVFRRSAARRKASTREAMVAKGLDKLETILQHTQGRNPADFDYAFNLDYGQRYTAADPVLAALRSRLDEATARRARDAGAGAGPEQP